MTLTRSTRAEDLLDTIGVNVHFGHGYAAGTNYATPVKDAAALKYVGIELVRDHLPSNATEWGYFDAAAKAGLKFDLIVNKSSSPAKNVSALKEFVQKHPGALHAIEGMNEVDLNPISFAGRTGRAAADAYQAELFRLVNADPLLKNIPVYNQTLGMGPPTNSTASSDVANYHGYRPNGDQPVAGIDWHLDRLKTVSGNKPIVVTETGYFTNPQHDNWQGVDETSAAKMILNHVMRADQRGVSESYFYQLLDGGTHTGTKSGRENYFGFFNSDWSPKASAKAMHNFQAILNDTGANKETFTTGSLNYSVSGLSSTTGGTKLLQKSNGTFDLVVWDESDIWDHVNDKPIVAAAKTVTVSLGATYGTVKVYDPMKGPTAIQTLSNVNKVSLSVTAHPLIIEVSKGAVDSPSTPMPRPDPADKIIDGTNSDNMILGTSAAETVNGLGGSDKIYGGGGNDILTGGAGEDYFTFDTALNASGNVDRITDINVDDDTIRLHDAVFSKLTREGALKSSWFEAGTKADDSNDYVIYDQGTGKLYYDADGIGSGAAVQFAMIENRANLTAASFLVL